MTRLRTGVAAALSVGLLSVTLGACGEELPTAVGSGLLPGGIVRTIEVTIDPSRYLVWDTAFAGYGSPGETGYIIAADRLDGVVQAHGLLRFAQRQRSVTAPDTAGTTRTDTIPAIVGSRFVLRVDTTASHSTGPVQVRLYQAAEGWDRFTANWTMRVDSPGSRLPWEQAGGTRGDLIGSGQWTPGVDSITIAIDSMAVRAWDDTVAVRRGAIVVAEGDEALLRASSISWRIDYQPAFRPDTTITVSQEALARSFIYTPTPPSVAGAARAGGVPGWRGMFRLRERLDTLQVPCPDRPNCMMPLSDVTITLAALRLHGVPSPAGFAPNDSIRIVAHSLLVNEAIPLQRSPLGDIVGVMQAAIPPGPALDAYEVPITTLLRLLAQPSDTIATPPPPYLALSSLTEGRSFGFASFAPAPSLRLVLTVATEVQLR